MTETKTLPLLCSACKRPIKLSRYTTADGREWHELCWQYECNKYYYEQTLDGGEADDC